MDLFEDLKQLFLKEMRSAVENKKELRIEYSDKSSTLSSYQDKYGTKQYLEWYMGEVSDGRHDYIQFSIKEIKDNSNSGFLSFKQSEIRNIEIDKEKSLYSYTKIKVDNINIIIKESK